MLMMKFASVVLGLRDFIKTYAYIFHPTDVRNTYSDFKWHNLSFKNWENLNECFPPSGTNVTYKIQHGSTELASTSAIRGIVPHNITVSPEVQQQLGPGCHQITVVALNRVTAVDRSTVLELCLVEPVEGLIVDVEPEHEQCPVHALYVNVSLAQGSPVQLHFLVSGANHTFSEMHEMLHGSPQVFFISNTIRGTAFHLFTHALEGQKYVGI